ncbi:MAG: hypothetical protein RL172_1022 [Bacteroidota bacterium]|jgi:hypothetical protein
MAEILLLLAGLVIGGIAMYAFFNRRTTPAATSIQHHTIVEKIERVFKIVLAEGYFSEIYDFKHTEKFLYLIPSTKKALLIVNAKVLMGYDFKKLKLEINEKTNEVRILEFPPPEILSVDPEVRYYNVEDNLLNKFSTTDLTQIQLEAKSMIVERARQSDLPTIAHKQMQNLLLELSELKNWKLTGVDKMLGNYTPIQLEPAK